MARLAGALLLLALPAYFAPMVGTQVSELYSTVDPGNPYFSATRPALLYGLLPLAFLGSCVLLLAPGLIVSATLGRATSIWRWLLEGFGFSLVLVSAAAGVVQAWMGRPLVGASFATVVFLLTMLAAAGGSFWLKGKDAKPSLPDPRGSVGPLLGLLAVTTAFLIGLTPKLFWEAFNGDGAHAFESSRLLLYAAVPFFDASAGGIAGWPGINGLVQPHVPSWFMRLFGEVEASVRLPTVMYVPLLFAAVVHLAETRSDQHPESGPEPDRRLTPFAKALTAGGIVSYMLVQSYSATYNPYSADVAMPAAHDALLMILALSAIASLLRRNVGWTLFWAFLALSTSPGGLVQFGLLIGALWVTARPRPWGLVTAAGLGLVLCLAAQILLSLVLPWLGVPVPGSEHGPVRLFIRQYGVIALADFERFLWVILPCGIYPVLGLFGWRRADHFTRALIVLTGLMFGMYYVMGALSLHYFVPVMIFPLVIFWRLHDTSDWSVGPKLLCAAGVLASLWFSLPSTSAIYTATRDVGQHLELRGFDGYETMDPAVFAASDRLDRIFPTDADPRVPDEVYGDSPLAWVYYANRNKDGNSSKAYALSSVEVGPPNGSEILVDDELGTVAIRDTRLWEQHKILKPRHSLGKAVYIVPREVLFYRGEDSERFGFLAPFRLITGDR